GWGTADAGIRSVHVPGVVTVVESLVVSPIVGLVLGFITMIALFWICRRSRPRWLNGIFRRLQMLSAGFMALSHGSNDAQKTMGIITMSLVAYGSAVSGTGGKFEVPTWVKLACATAMALGTAAGGMRLIKPMGPKHIDLKPIQGFAAEPSAAATILTSSFLGMPVSTTHVITGCIMGAGASQRVSAVRWGVTTKILWAWVLTIPISATVAWLCYHGAGALLGP